MLAPRCGSSSTCVVAIVNDASPSVIVTVNGTINELLQMIRSPGNGGSTT